MSADPKKLFPHARDAPAALSGLVLMAGHWDLSHQIAQDISSREGSYWHAIAHRIEPDSPNSGYWFRQDAMKLGASDFLQKPVDPTRLSALSLSMPRDSVKPKLSWK